MAKATHDDVSVLTLDAASYLTTDLYEGRLTIENELVQSRGVGETFSKNCIVKKSASLDLQLSSSGANCKITGLDLSAITVASINFLDYLESLDFSIRNEYQREDGVSDEWRSNQYVAQDLSSTARFMIPTDAATTDNVILGAASSTLSNSNAVLAFTINSVAFSVPMVAGSAVHMFTRADLQMWEFTFAQRDAHTDPAGTSTLLTKALNAPGTAQALVLTSKAAGGVQYSGNFLPESCQFSVNRQDVILNQFRYISQGALTAAATV